MLIMMKLLIQAFVIIVISNVAFTANVALNQCRHTPEIQVPDKIPDHFKKSNNLLSAVGSPIKAEGETIILTGKILDSSCVPITNAIVHIWHPDHRGIYPAEGSTGFTGSGTSSSSNTGIYQFLTVMPGKRNKRAPHINIIIRHEDFLPFQTQIFFEDAKDNKTDEILNSLSKNARPLLHAHAKDHIQSDSKVYVFDIVLPSKNKYKKY